MLRPWGPIIGIAVSLTLASAASASPIAAVPGKFKNCTALNKRYAHGVGRVGARDKTSSGNPVTTFKRSNRLYELNKGLDRDKDRIACERSAREGLGLRA
jgi:hypothetical protein